MEKEYPSLSLSTWKATGTSLPLSPCGERCCPNALINDILELCVCLNLSPPVHSHSKKSDDPPNLQVNVSLSYQWLLDYYSSYPSGNTKDPFGRQGARYVDNTAHGLLTIMSKVHVSGCATVSMSTMEVSVLVDHQDGETHFCQSRHAACWEVVGGWMTPDLCTI